MDKLVFVPVWVTQDFLVLAVAAVIIVYIVRREQRPGPGPPGDVLLLSPGCGGLREPCHRPGPVRVRQVTPHDLQRSDHRPAGGVPGHLLDLEDPPGNEIADVGEAIRRGRDRNGVRLLPGTLSPRCRSSRPATGTIGRWSWLIRPNDVHIFTDPVYNYTGWILLCGYGAAFLLLGRYWHRRSGYNAAVGYVLPGARNDRRARGDGVTPVELPPLARAVLLPGQQRRVG